MDLVRTSVQAAAGVAILDAKIGDKVAGLEAKIDDKVAGLEAKIDDKVAKIDTIDDKVAALGRSRLIADFSSPELRRLAPYVAVKHLAAGEEVVREGDSGSTLFILGVIQHPRACIGIEVSRS